MFILLPPSEGKTPGGTGKWTAGSGKYGRLLRAARVQVANDLPVATAAQLKIPQTLVAVSHSANARLATGAPILPASRRYTGVVFKGLDSTGLSSAENDTANERIVMVSGLLGLVGFNDPTPDYRAPIDARTPSLGNLASWWRPTLTRALYQLDGDIVDLLPQSHRHAVVLPPGRGWTVDLVHGTVRGGHDAKCAKGRFARWLLTNDIRSWKKWRDDGWRVDVTPPSAT